MRPTAIWDLRGACLLQIMSIGLFTTFEAVHMAENGLEPGLIGTLLALENGLFIVTSPVWGALADRTGRYRKLIMASTVGLAVNLCIFAYADSTAGFVLYAVVRGLFAPGIQSLMSVLAVAVVGPTQPGRGFGRYRAFGSIGFILGTGLLPLLLGDISTTCLVGAFLLLASIGFVQRLPRVSQTKDTAESDVAVLDWKRLALFFGAYFLVLLLEPGVHGFFGAYARELGAEVSTVGLLASMTGLMALLGLPVVGSLIDRLGASRVFLAAIVCQVARMLLVSTIHDPNWLWTAHLFHFIAWPGREIGAIVLLTTLTPPAARGRVIAVLASVRMAGVMTGSFVMGQLVNAFGYAGMYFWISVIAAPSILIFLLFMRLFPLPLRLDRPTMPRP